MHKKIYLVVLLLSVCFSFSAQEIKKPRDIESLLSEFYSELTKSNNGNSLMLTKSIDSILTIKNELNIESLAIYNNSKGVLYSHNDLNPEKSFIKADSLNNLLSTPNIGIKAYSSYFLGEFYFDNKEDVKAKAAYSKIIEIPNIPKEFFSYKSTALNKTFYIDRTLVNQNINDSLEAKITARKMIDFYKSINDTIQLEYGKALDYLNNIHAAEAIYLNIKSISEADSKYNNYTKFQALFWLNTYYYKVLSNNMNSHYYHETNRNNDDITLAHKLVEISEELLALIENTDFLELHNIYSIYADIICASLVTKDNIRIKKYEGKILKIVNQVNYPQSVSLNLERFYYTVHKLKMHFEFNKNFERAKFYSLKNVELTKLVYGDKSIEYEQELGSYERIIRLDFFNYEEAYNVSLKREKIIKHLFGINSEEYLEVLADQYSLKLNQRDHKKGLEILEEAISILKNVQCEDSKVCQNIIFNYLDSLNFNKLFDEALKQMKNFDYINNYESLLRLASTRRASYNGLNQANNLNFEFEWLLERISGQENTLKNDKEASHYFYTFLNDYNQHLRLTGRLNKAIGLSEKYMDLFIEYDNDMTRVDFMLSYANTLYQIQQCNKALKFIEDNNILKFSDLSSPGMKAYKEHNYNFTLGNIYNCLEKYPEAIMAYENAIEYNGIDTSHLLIPLIGLYNSTGNKAKTNFYLNKYEKNLSDIASIDLEELYLLADLMITINDREKLLKYLLPLSEKVIDDICEKSFFSSNDNKFDKITHDDVLRFILSHNYGDLYNYELEQNAIIISDLYKRRLDYYAQINIGIQKLKTNRNEDALLLQSLESEYNRKPNELIEEEINQLKTKFINSGLASKSQLCDVIYDNIYESITDNEIVIDIKSYKYNLAQASDNFVINYIVKDYVQSFDFNLNDHLGLKNANKISSSLFDFLAKNIFSNSKVNGDKIDTFYFITSGTSHLMNFSAFSLSFEEKFKRKLKIHRINSLSDIPTIKAEQRQALDNLILIGDIDFDKVSDNYSTNSIAQFRGVQLNNLIENSEIPHWGYLPGTKQEIEDIEQLATTNKINVSILRETEVTESNLKNIIIDSDINNVIHVATHAYFFPDDITTETNNFFATHKNPLLRSGLVLSGANEFWNNKLPVDANNDGILTSEEISYMDLRGVELVVLSACDTGLGDVSNLEGVNGLQRAFKLAGANKLIMSLWKVPDTETAEFFNYFYKFLLEEKLSVNDAFRETQRIMKEKYSPNYWAGFVLLE